MKYKHFDIPINERDLSFIDTEFTNFALFKSELLEIGIVRVKANTFEIIDEIDIKIKPSHIETANPESLKVVGYDEKEWDEEGMDLKKGVEIFLDFVKDSILVAQNLPADWMILQKSIEECGLKPTYFYKGLDTFSLGWLLHGDKPEFPKLSLKELANHYNVDMGQHHRAIDDARTAYRIFLKLIKDNA